MFYSTNHKFLTHLKKLSFLAVLLTSVATASAQSNGPKTPSISDPFVMMMVIIMVILLLIIGLLANVVTGAAAYYREQQKEQEKKDIKADESSVAQPVKVLSAVTVLMVLSSKVSAQNAISVSAPGSTAFYLMTGVLAIELIVIFSLLYLLKGFLAKSKKLSTAAASPAVAVVRKNTLKSVWNRLNRFRPLGQESQIQLDHEYDGIRELDNRLPPWWLYGFYLTIVFAGIYLWRYHVSHTAPLAEQELQIAMADAEVQKKAYLKNAANLVDENTVKLLTDATEIQNGKKIFELNCAACHGKAGEGTVGPNLTDEYWLHGGNISDIFKTIKYGWPEKGMKSWKDDFSPAQIAQLTSYIKTLKGTNPPNAKEKQGELFSETTETNPPKADSSANQKISAVRF
jgi:cytochrome c oxidase cbb3-type subunit 3